MENSICTRTAEETQYVYDSTLNGWMTIGEDEYVMKDCRLRIEGSYDMATRWIEDNRNTANQGYRRLVVSFGVLQFLSVFIILIAYWRNQRCEWAFSNN